MSTHAASRSRPYYPQSTEARTALNGSLRKRFDLFAERATDEERWLLSEVLALWWTCYSPDFVATLIAI
jgi:hypothetical protein